MDKKKKNKTSGGQFSATFIYALIGVWLGFSSGSALEFSSFLEYIKILALLTISVCVGIVLATIVHELGHLVFGLLTGYRFQSFRIFKFMLKKEKNGKLHFCSYSLVTTAGQCLMLPPAFDEENFPYVLYNMGGVIFNAVFCILFNLLRIHTAGSPYTALAFNILMSMNLAMLLTNGIPLKLNGINNDGYNAFAAGKTPESLYGFWLQLQICGEYADGTKLSDMPDEWFSCSPEAIAEDSMSAAVAVYAENRLMEKHDFENSEKTAAELADGDNAVVGIHKAFLGMDRIFCMILRDASAEDVRTVYTKLHSDKTTASLLKAMAVSNPAIARTEYAYQSVIGKDVKKADNALKTFEKLKKTYPNQTEIETEEELIRLIQAKQPEEENK